jgi:beta-xylosidase
MEPRIVSWGDQGDGTYRNPVLFADFSDPDVIRVGSDFYLIASEFHYMGMQVLHSRDLVNWTIIGQVFESLKVSPRYDQMSGYSRGTWAPSLRYHDGRYYIYVCTPEEGLFMWHAADPRGPWSDVVCLRQTEKWEDPCPFWDDNGNAYLVHGRLGAGPLILHRMTPDGMRLLDDGQEIYYGRGAEGPKMFKRNGWYYISLPENGVALGGQTLIRSRKIYGPYERKVMLPDCNPHQGGMVDLENGEGWFIGFQYREHSGRVCHLVPYRWQDDDWPKFGEGHVMAPQAWEKPDVGAVYPVSRPTVSDEFNTPDLQPVWQWNHNPVREKWSLTARPGFLRLTAMPAAEHALARNTLTQKIWDSCGLIDVKLHVEGMADGQQAGFAFINAKQMGWVGVAQKGSARTVTFGAHDGAVGMGPDIEGDCLWLRGEYLEEICRFYYSLDGKAYTPVPVKFRLRFAGWKGARVGLYSFGSDGGHADFDYFRMVYGSTLPLCRSVAAQPS